MRQGGVKRRLRPHDLRHEMITKALEEGADTKAFSKLIRSSPETQGKHYQRVATDRRCQTIAKTPEIKIPNKEEGRLEKRPKFFIFLW